MKQRWQYILESTPESVITLGLERCSAVKLVIEKSPVIRAQLVVLPLIISVAGTNGKGSTSTFCAEILKHQGKRVGLYTSPHLMRFHERINMAGEDINDSELNSAMIAVETAREEANVPLSYYEYATLAAWWHFVMNSAEVIVFEVGLGGRLDAVNIWDADVAIVTTINLDHQEYLGNTREAIALEKAAIARADKPVFCAEPTPPENLFGFWQELTAKASFINIDYSPKVSAHLPHQWSLVWQDATKPNNTQLLSALPLPRLRGVHQLRNAATAIRAAQSLLASAGETISSQAIRKAMVTSKMAGRIEYCPRIKGEVSAWLDVAHNAEAAKVFADAIGPALPSQKTWAILGILANKEVELVVQPFLKKVDCWLLAGLQGENAARGLTAKELDIRMAPLVPDNKRACFDNPSVALSSLISGTATMSANGNDRIIIFGSFHTVATCQSVLSCFIT